MTKRVVLTSLVLLLYLLQVTVLPQLLLYRIRVDLLIIWVVAYALLTGPREGLLCGLFVGLLLDLGVEHPFGLQILLKGLAGYLSGTLARKFFREQLLLPLLVILSVLMMQEAISFTILNGISGVSIVFDRELVNELLLMVLYTICFGSGIYRIMVSLVGWLDRTAYERSERR
ncbi:MAG: rod shape-determining protein MreD [Symbiobacteriaceae bacterium]|nr:rod shape-determining protein MreD [Symbiobacteriaceae bacterium]